MFKINHNFSMVTAVMPTSKSARVLPSILRDTGIHALTWRARGTLLHDNWWKQWFPPINPTKTMLQMLVPDKEVDRLVNTVVEHGNLHQQATGAVFSTPCEHVYFGSEFNTWQVPEEGTSTLNANHSLTENLSVIYAIVGRSHADRIARAAINKGAHGPIVYYSEGRGLRDRLGWLRITKEHDKEVLMIITDEDDADDVFDAMMKAGDLHLPGHGFMYRVGIDKGMFNIPSRVSNHHYDANMQQIISAIDHLSGHDHWRDQSVFAVGGEGRSIGLGGLGAPPLSELQDQVGLTVISPRDHGQDVMDLLLDAGAPGLNISYARFTAPQASEHLAGANLTEEYGMLRCITNEVTAQKICAQVDRDAEGAGLLDFCMTVHRVPRVATYIPGKIDYRDQQREDDTAMAS